MADRSDHTVHPEHMRKPGARAAIFEAARALASISDTPRLDAELLMAHALGITREAMLLGANRPEPPEFASLLARRRNHEPVAYILGTRAFWTLELTVNRDVLIPRADSETLITEAMAHFADRAPPRRILDIGTGSGALLLAALAQWPDAHGVGVDISAAALAVARANGDRLNISSRAHWLQADFCVPGWGKDVGGAFDLVLANPPYIASGAGLDPQVADYEPALALYAGPDGLAAYRQLMPVVPELMAPTGIACIEVGHDQADAVGQLFPADLGHWRVAQDLAQRDRCLCFTLHAN